MKEEAQLGKNFAYGAIVIGIVLAILSWPIETAIHSYLFHGRDFVARLWPEDGNELTMRLMISGLFLGFGFLSAYFINAATRLKVQNLIFGKALHAMHESVFITDSEHKIIYVNPAFCDTTHFSLEEVLGKQPTMLMPGKQSKEFQVGLWQTLAEKNHWEGEIWDRKKTGELYPQWLNIDVVRDQHHQIKYHVGVFTDITAKKAVEDKMRKYAFYDPLTGLPNRQFFMEQVSQMVKRAKRQQEKVGLIFLDLDRFKKVNDKYGHLMGDQLLCEAVAIVKPMLRDTDVMARFAGDEFVIMLASVANHDDIKTIADRILAAFAKHPVKIGDNDFHISVTLGAALFPDHANDENKLLELADKAMLEAKQQQRGSYLVAREKKVATS